MLDTEIIEWGYTFAEGYTLRYIKGLTGKLLPMIIYTNGLYFKEYDLTLPEWKLNKYGDFLTRVIEGINKDHKRHSLPYIDQLSDCITIDCRDFALVHIDGEHTPDQAKEKAIEYIYREIVKKEILKDEYRNLP